MSIYPPAAAGQGLYVASQVAKAKLGTRMSFETDEGVVEAIYCKNNNAASLAAGFVVGHPWDNDATPWTVDTAAIANVSAGRQQIVGMLCASMQGTATNLSSPGYAWVAYRGPVTNAALAENVASNALLYVTVNSAARFASIATAIATAASLQSYQHNNAGRYGATASTISRASTTTVSGHYIFLFGWK